MHDHDADGKPVGRPIPHTAPIFNELLFKYQRAGIRLPWVISIKPSGTIAPLLSTSTGLYSGQKYMIHGNPSAFSRYGIKYENVMVTEGELDAIASVVLKTGLSLEETMKAMTDLKNWAVDNGRPVLVQSQVYSTVKQHGDYCRCSMKNRELLDEFECPYEFLAREGLIPGHVNFWSTNQTD